MSLPVTGYTPGTVDTAGLAEVIVAKNRSGPTATTTLTFLPRFADFHPVGAETATHREDATGDEDVLHHCEFVVDGDRRRYGSSVAARVKQSYRSPWRRRHSRPPSNPRARGCLTCQSG